MRYFKKNIHNWLLVTLLLGATVFNAAYAQVNAYANPYVAGILPNVDDLIFGNSTTVTMNLGNNGASPIPAGGAVFNISFTENITPDLSTLKLDGVAFTGGVAGPFTMTSFEDGGVLYMQLTVSGAGIPAKTGPGAKTSFTITIDVKGTKNGGPVDMILNVVADNAISQNLDAGDDNATAPIRVGPLPVKLVSFSVKKEGNAVQLNWATTEEINAGHFNVERSVNAKDWATIGEKAAAGESKALLNYNFTDAAPVAGSNYYRLKMIDRDQTFAYSSIKSIEFDNQGYSLSIYPNPVSNVLFLKSEAGNLVDVKEVEIINANGVTAYKAENSTNASFAAAGISISSLANGIYIVKVTKVNGQVSSHKIVITK